MPRYVVETRARATIGERWVFDSPKRLTRDQVERLLERGLMECEEDWCAGEEEDRRVVEVREGERIL